MALYPVFPRSIKFAPYVLIFLPFSCRLKELDYIDNSFRIRLTFLSGNSICLEHLIPLFRQTLLVG